MNRFLGLTLAVLVAGASGHSARKVGLQSAPAARQHAAAGPALDLQGFAALDPIDAHAHVFKEDPSVQTLLRHLHLHMLNICVFDDRDPDFRHLHPMLLTALAVVRHSHGHMAWCTTFDPYKFREPDFHADTIRQLDANFLQGAVAVKVWKNVGMELRTPDGNFVMPDDPTFEPIYQDIGAHHKTLIIHAAEPTSCWQPPNPASPDYEYYQHHPEWYMYIHPDHPSKQTILQARDHVLAENPQLRVVGAHLGSMELDVDDIARHFDRYPNFAVDTAARVVYLALQPRDKVRAFIIKYQDRILYGTDLGLAPGQNADSLAYWQSTYDRDWKFFATRETVEYEGHKVQGLDLPRGVLRKLYHDNAARWIPGVLSGTRGP